MATKIMRITLKAYDHQLVDQSAGKIIETVKKNGSKVSGPVPLPTKKEVVTILRAVHKYKDSREQFEQRTHKRLIDVIKPSKKAIEAIVEEPELGRIYKGVVKTITTFGAFVEILPGKDGLCHISKLDRERVEKVEDVCKEGDTMIVKVMEIDEKTGKISLSRKDAMLEIEDCSNNQ